MFVSVQTRGQLVGNVYADSEGKFGFYDLAPNAYEVTLTVQGYEPITQVVRIDPLLSPTQFVELVLNPVAVRDRNVRELHAGSRTEIDVSASTLRKLAMS